MPDPVAGTVEAVQVGAVRPLGPKAVPSAIVKSPVTGPFAVGPLGLEGDAQVDPARPLSVTGQGRKCKWQGPRCMSGGRGQQDRQSGHIDPASTM